MNRIKRYAHAALTSTQVASAALIATGLMAASSATLAQDKTTLVIAAPSTPQGLDNEYDVSLGTVDVPGALYDYLFEYETVPDAANPAVMREDTQVHPERVGGLALRGKLAESWEISPDGKTITFTLRKGVKSNWGNELTADDVKWSWDRKFALAAQGSFYTAVIGLKADADVKVEGPYKVSFHLAGPTPLALKIHTLLGNPIYDSKKIKEVGGAKDPWGKEFLKTNSAGFGPYRVKQITRGQQAVFEARPDYYGKQPYMKTVVVREIPNSASRMSLLQGGAVDIAQFLQPREYDSLKSNPNVKVSAVDASYMMWMVLNAKVPPFDKPEVRQAVNYAIPRDEIIRTAFYGYGSKQVAPLPLIYPGADGSFFKYDYNPQKAKELLAKAGFPNGFSTTISFDAGNAVQEPVATIIQSALRNIGINAQLEKLPAGVFYENVTKRTKPIIFYQDAPWAPDAGYATYLFFHEKSFPNYSNYANARVTELIEAGMKTTDDNKRASIYRDVQKQIMEDAPWGFLAYPKYVLAHRTNLQGFTYYTSNNLRFQDFYRK